MHINFKILFLLVLPFGEGGSKTKMEKAVSTALVLIIMLSSVLGIGFTYSSGNQYPSLAHKDLEIVSRVNGTKAWNYDLELEKIALNHDNSNYAFRSSGSLGANETAHWIKEQFENSGLETTMESFEFATWNLPNQPSLVIHDGDGNAESNRTIISSFQSTHYSWPTPEGGLSRDLVVLPLTDRSRSQIYEPLFNNLTLVWNTINLTGKILLIGYELRWNAVWHQAFWNKLKSQTPAAIIYTWWYPWMSSFPPSFASVGGLPAGDRGPYYWQLKIPVGWVSYEDGLLIRKREKSVNVSANFSIPAVIKPGPHYNVVGKLKSSVNPEKSIIISSHYDTVMTSGFCDNGAGTAGVLELARVFADAAKEGWYNPEYTLLFIAFAGEELGLVGSINYMKQHEAEMKNVVAVINLDCIGSDVFHITETFPDDNGLDLDELVKKAADDLGVKVVLEEAGVAGDEYTFRNPKMATDFYENAWGLNAGIASVARVKSSITLISFPLFINDEWENKTLATGWIHTQYDNSTSTATLNWVEFDDLNIQIQVAALSVIRISSNGFITLSQILIAMTAITAVIGVVVCLKRSLVTGTLKRMYGSLVDYIELKELVVTIILTALFLFASIVSYTRVGRIEVTRNEIPTPVTMLYLGYPFEMIASEQSTRTISFGGSEGGPPLDFGRRIVGTLVLWNGLMLDLLLYFVSALFLVYVVVRLRNRWQDTSARADESN